LIYFVRNIPFWGSTKESSLYRTLPAPFFTSSQFSKAECSWAY